MSKHGPVTKATAADPKTGVAYWQSRLFRNSYTRRGRTVHVRNWSVKIQHAGTRRTLSLAAPDRAAAAAEALVLFRIIRTRGWDVALRDHSFAAQSEAPAPEDAAATEPFLVRKPRLLSRPYGTTPLPNGDHELSAQIEHAGRSHYFPLSTADATEAARRARRIQQIVLKEGLAAAGQRFPRELTVGLHWASNPVSWTYFTVHTRVPGGTNPVASVSSGRSPTLPIVLVEPDDGLRRALAGCLNLQAGLHCRADFGNTADALLWLARNRAALVLVQRELGELSGGDFLDRVRHVAPQLPGLLYSVHEDSEQLFKSTPGGAMGYLLKRSPANLPLEPLAGWPAGRWPTADEIAERARACFQRLGGPPPPATPNLELTRLTARELETLGLLSKGLLDKEVAHVLGISVWTVHGHVKRIFEKLGVHSRTEAVVKYLQK